MHELAYVPPMRASTPLAALVAIALVFGGGYALLTWHGNAQRREREERRAELQTLREERAREQEELLHEQMEPVRRDSAALMPEQLGDVQLGIDEETLRSLRDVRRRRDESDPTMRFYEEMLTSHAQIVYGVDAELDVLTRVQVMSSIPPEGVAPHLQAMLDRYGSPDGVWNCPASGATGLPMRRFTWFGEAVTVQDILLLHPRGVSQTLYIAPSEQIAASLRISHCTPIRSAEELADIPIATREQMLEAIEETGTNVAF